MGIRKSCLRKDTQFMSLSTAASIGDGAIGLNQKEIEVRCDHHTLKILQSIYFAMTSFQAQSFTHPLQAYDINFPSGETSLSLALPMSCVPFHTLLHAPQPLLEYLA